MSEGPELFSLAFRLDGISQDEDAADRRRGMGGAFDQSHMKDNEAERHTFHPHVLHSSSIKHWVFK